MSKVNYKHRNLKDALYGLVCLANIATTDKELVDNLEGDCKREIAEYELTRKELAQYKIIEEELGIDLVKFASTFIKEDIYLKDKDGNVCCCDYEVTYNKDEKGWYFESCLLGKYYFKDYGKTWALTEEELTNKEKELIEKGLLTDKPQF